MQWFNRLYYINNPYSMWQTNYSVVYINYCSISCILLFNHNYWQGGMSVSLSCHRDVCINLLPQGCLYQSLGTGMPVPTLILILYFNLTISAIFGPSLPVGYQMYCSTGCLGKSAIFGHTLPVGHQMYCRVKFGIGEHLRSMF